MRPEVSKALSAGGFKIRFNGLEAGDGSEVNLSQASNEMNEDQEELLEQYEEMKRNTYPLLPLLAQVANQLFVVGLEKESEQALAFYTTTMETLFGKNSQQMAEIYFWLGVYYQQAKGYEQQTAFEQLQKAKICYHKARLICIGYLTE